jgi:hypothetical protein
MLGNNKKSIGFNSSLYNASGSNVDPSAAAFILAAGITNPTQQSAINTLVISLKTANIYSKMIALYPFVGGSATSHKYNLINPLDTNAAFRLSFSGGFTHNANGINPNGTNAFADTFLSGSNLVNNNTSWSFYSRSDQTNDNLDIGAANGSGTGLYCFTKRTVGNGGMVSYLYELPRLDVPLIAASTKLIGASRVSNISQKSFREGVVIGTNVVLNTFNITTMTTNIVICAYRANSGGIPILHSSRNLAFLHIGMGLSDAEFLSLATIVNTYQTSLGRNV